MMILSLSRVFFLSTCIAVTSAYINTLVTPPTCKKIDSCSCQWEHNKTIVDLHAVGLNGGIKFKDYPSIQPFFKFSYNPCYPFTETSSGAQTDDCHGVASCETDMSGANFYDGGLQNKTHFFTQSVTSGGNDWILTLQYVSADASRETEVWLFCASYENFTAIGEMPGSVTTFIYELYSPHACPFTPTISFGTILCIIFACVVLIYFVVGFLIMRFARGATGIEAIPNSSFWKSSPTLVKDGFQFVASGFKAKSSGYESLD